MFQSSAWQTFYFLFPRGTLTILKTSQPSFSNYPDRNEGVRDSTPGKMKNVTCVSFSPPGALLCQLPLSPLTACIVGGM